MKVPISVNDLTLKQFIGLKRIEDSEISEFEKGEQILMLVAGISQEQVNDLPLWKAQFYFKKIAQLRSSKPNLKVKKWLFIKGKIYRLVKSEKHLNTNQLTAADTFAIDSVSNFNKLAAIVYTHKGKFTDKSFEDLTNYFANCKVGRIYGAVFFYSIKLQRLKADSKVYFQKAKQTIQERLTELKSKITDGTQLLIVSRAETLLERMN